MKMKLLPLIALLPLASSAWSGPYEDGLAAAIKKDYATAIKLWQPLAQMGVKKNPLQESNYQKAIEAVGKQDYLAALFLFQSLAEKGSVTDAAAPPGGRPAQDDAKITKLYQEGMAAALKKDYATALKLWQPLAQTGHALSQYALAVMHRDGYGILKDDIRALMWFNVSVTHLPESAKEIDIISRRLSPAQIAEAKKLGLDCQAKNFNGC